MSSGGADAFVTKINREWGASYSTYLGGNGDDYGNGIAVDATNNAYLVGYTAGNNSNSFPRLNAYQTVFWRRRRTPSLPSWRRAGVSSFDVSRWEFD
jgi:hypothetical protein